MFNPFSRRASRRRPVLSALAVLGLAAVLSVTFATTVSAAQEPDGPSPYESALASVVEALRSRLDAEQSPPVEEPAPEKRACRYAGGDSRDVPRQITMIFRCHLREAGVSDRRARQMAAEAVVVAHCESLFDPEAVVFDGRYRDTPHPNGNRYSAAGVFQFIRKTADKWIDGGYSNVLDTRLNIDAAARLFVHNRSRGYRGWDDWACAAANDGFKVGSVLPGWAGGPQHLPTWAYYD